MCARPLVATRQRTAAPLDAAATALCSPCSARQQRQRGPFGGGGTISERTGALEHSPADWVSPEKGLMAKCPNSPVRSTGSPGLIVPRAKLANSLPLAEQCMYARQSVARRLPSHSSHGACLRASDRAKRGRARPCRRPACGGDAGSAKLRRARRADVLLAPAPRRAALPRTPCDTRRGEGRGLAPLGS